MVIFENVTKTYDGKSYVLSELNLTIEEGGFVTLLGPSGSGKTTTLMMLAGFEEPTAGDILLNGRSIKGLQPYKRKLGVVFQNYALFPHMTVGGNIAFPLQQRRLPRAEIARRVQRALEMISLPHAADRKPSQLSGGQQQRVALARALVFEPNLVLLDEPLGALDKQLREQLQMEMKHLHARLGLTFVYVTHDQAEALAMSSKIAIFNRGRIEQYAPPDEIYTAPATDFVANFVGDNNRLLGSVGERSDQACVVKVAGLEVRTSVHESCESGSDVALSIRPECVRLNPETPLDNNFQGNVQEIIYGGESRRVIIDVQGRFNIALRTPANARSKPVNMGDPVTIGWDASDCRVFRI